MKLHKSLAVFIVSISTISLFPNNLQASQQVYATRYATCSKLKAKYKSGIASSKKSKGSTRAFVNSALYKANKGLDTNANGIACDSKDGQVQTWNAADYSGTGPSVLTLSIPDGQVGFATISHTGSSNFAVHSLDKNLEIVDLLVNEIGNYSGSVFLSRGYSFSTQNVKALQIEADGNWTVRVAPASSSAIFSGNSSGLGDAVLRYGGSRSTLKIQHSGSSNFVVQTYNNNGSLGDLLVNEIGNYSGTVILPNAAYIVVQADGQWSLTK